MPPSATTSTQGDKKVDPRGDHRYAKNTPGVAPGKEPYVYQGSKDSKIEDYDVVVVGAGLSGAIIGRRFAEEQGKKVLIVEKRAHIGGNCFDYIDEETGILMNQYGAHLFFTDHQDVYDYICKFAKWKRWEHQVVGMIDGQFCCIPPNITTINMVCNQNIKTIEQMDKWLAENRVKYDKITNGEEMAKSRVGEVLYEKIFKHYTYKQWQKWPRDIAPEVFARLPARNDYDTRYKNRTYQCLPEEGYTPFFVNLLKHDNVDVHLNTDFFALKDKIPKGKIIIYTGPVDYYFASLGFEKLEYRSIRFHIERKMNYGFYQPNSVVNYPGPEVDFTRIVEYKHFLNQKSPHTIIVKETTTDEGDPYYPVLNDRNKALFQKYKKLADQEKDVHFVGRLANYKYFDMEAAIKNALDYFNDHFGKENKQS
eukprot:CAMPEP_0197524654 /NCGR_PEP_ID=MMETSP1318-20131121/9263_1 /TAXON_ID=552666 /ORGANISM="Partenskyella glossopodia, Strain RCC365" /LENGTH=422 /DNA_ID=CAMNT_0043077643 /DNA_START=62 /DNA_END=1330 /DNA_ORIENTATION=+